MHTNQDENVEETVLGRANSVGPHHNKNSVLRPKYRRAAYHAASDISDAA
jgi:hypothetical protein